MKVWEEYFKAEKKKVVFEFDNERAAYHFLAWLSNSGEQQYWQSQEYREGDEPGPITAIDFDYNFENLSVIAKCGRFSEDFEE